MDLEIVILSEVGQKKRNMEWQGLYCRILKMIQVNLFTKWKQTHWLSEWMHDHQEGAGQWQPRICDWQGESTWDWPGHMLCSKQTTNKDLLCSTGNSAQYQQHEAKVTRFLTRYWKVNMRATQSCPTLWDPVDYVVHGVLQARILEWVAYPFSSGSSRPRNQTWVSRTAGRFFTNWAPP